MDAGAGGVDQPRPRDRSRQQQEITTQAPSHIESGGSSSTTSNKSQLAVNNKRTSPPEIKENDPPNHWDTYPNHTHHNNSGFQYDETDDFVTQVEIQWDSHTPERQQKTRRTAATQLSVHEHLSVVSDSAASSSANAAPVTSKRPRLHSPLFSIAPLCDNPSQSESEDFSLDAVSRVLERITKAETGPPEVPISIASSNAATHAAVVSSTGPATKPSEPLPATNSISSSPTDSGVRKSFSMPNLPTPASSSSAVKAAPVVKPQPVAAAAPQPKLIASFSMPKLPSLPLKTPPQSIAVTKTSTPAPPPAPKGTPSLSSTSAVLPKTPAPPVKSSVKMPTAPIPMSTSAPKMPTASQPVAATKLQVPSTTGASTAVNPPPPTIPATDTSTTTAATAKVPPVAPSPTPSNSVPKKPTAPVLKSSTSATVVSPPPPPTKPPAPVPPVAKAASKPAPSFPVLPNLKGAATAAQSTPVKSSTTTSATPSAPAATPSAELKPPSTKSAPSLAATKMPVAPPSKLLSAKSAPPVLQKPQAKQSAALIVRETSALLDVPFRRYFVLGVYPDVAQQRTVVDIEFAGDRATKYHLVLVDQWRELELYPGDAISLRATFENGAATIDMSFKNVLVVFPDEMMPPTEIGHQCERRSFLNQRHKSNFQGSKALIGSMVHDSFERCLEKGWSERTISASLREHVQRNFANIDKKDTAEAVLQIAEAKMQSLMRWQKDQKISVLEIEESIWSPNYGLKGKIDVTIEDHSDPTRPQLKPFELKTGVRLESVHTAQVGLYTLLLEERYKTPVTNSIIYYANGNNATNDSRDGGRSELAVKTTPQMLSQLIIRRNKLVLALKRNVAPAMAGGAHLCGYCPVQNTCTLYALALPSERTVRVPEYARARLQRPDLTEAHLEYFAKWLAVIDLESQTVRNDFLPWNTPSVELEKSHRCLSHMLVLEEPNSSHLTLSQQASDGGYVTKFISKNKPPPPLPSTASASQSSGASQKDALSGLLLRCPNWSPGDFVIISTEEGHCGLSYGLVAEITPEYIAIRSDEPLKLPPLRPEDRAKISPPDIEDICFWLKERRKQSVIWRLDLMDSDSSTGFLRSSLVELFGAGEHDRRIRSLLIDGRLPAFSQEKLEREFGAVLSANASLVARMNEDQRAALEKVLSAEDYALIQGFPGTGKTQTIAYIVSILAMAGKRVLIASLTNNALDNVLLKLAPLGVDFLRLASKTGDKVAPAIRAYTIEAAAVTTEEQYRALLDRKLVWATTCTNASKSNALRGQLFDYCIVDEAGQITEPMSVASIRLAKIFVLVGDDRQLSPVVRSDEAREKGLNVSLLERLVRSFGGIAATPLQIQYRMSPNIMKLANRMTYLQLRAGYDVSQWQPLALNAKELKTFLPGNPWVLSILDPLRDVLFVNTDQVPAREGVDPHAPRTDSSLNESYQNCNNTEAQLVVQTVQALVIGGVSPSAIGVISPYRAQVRTLKVLLGNRLRTVEVSTVDSFQGKDKDCIIISLVKSNEDRNCGNLLDDPHRTNVAMTRAKKKLIIFGSRSTVAVLQIFDLLLSCCDKESWVENLPRGAHQLFRTALLKRLASVVTTQECIE